MASRASASRFWHRRATDTSEVLARRWSIVGPGNGLELGLDFDKSATGQAPRFWPLVLVAIGAGLLWVVGGKLVRREAIRG